jgi:phosphatidylglycerol:prolipoprotein diacylglycerol transferase
MNKKLKDLQRSKVKFFGFEYDSKAFLISMGVALGAFVLLIALTIIGIEISWYGVLFGTGFLVALVLSSQLCKERDVDSEFPYTLIWFVFPLSILGARVYYLAFHGGIDSIVDIITFWQGGLAVYGGIIGGLIGLIIGCLWKKVNIISMTDIAAPLLALGQFFGRIGCIFGECCYGIEVKNAALHWFPISVNVHGTYYYATNFYESIFNLVLFFVLTIILRKLKIKGIVTCSYLVGYGLVRFILETFRAEEQLLLIGNYPVSKLLSVICVMVGVIGISTLLIVNNLKKNKADEQESK